MGLHRRQKLIVIGCPGSGKSTFARALAQKSGLPLYHLDMMYWNADRTTKPKEEFRAELGRVIALPEWIIDGNYGSTLELRMETCDTVIFLDYPLDVCLSGIAERRGKPREDIPWVETEVDEDFIEFVKNYNRDSRPKVMELIEKYPDKNIIIFKSREQSDKWLSLL